MSKTVHHIVAGNDVEYASSSVHLLFPPTGISRLYSFLKNVTGLVTKFNTIDGLQICH